MDWSQSFLPETNLGQKANGSGTRIEELEKENENLLKQIEAKKEEVLFYARRMQDEELKCRDLTREVNVMQETLTNYCSRLSQEEEGAKALQRERDQWKKRADQERENVIRLQNQRDQWKKRLSEVQTAKGRVLQEQREQWKRRLLEEQKNCLQWKNRFLEEQENCLQWKNSSLASQKITKGLQEECAQLRQRLSEAEAGSWLLQQKLDSCKASSLTSQKMAKGLQEKCAQLTQRLSEAEAGSRLLQQKLDSYRGRLTQGEENTKVLKKQYREVKNRSEQEEENVKVLQKHCQDWIDRYSELRDAYNNYAKNTAETLERLNEQLLEKDNELRRLGEELKMKTQRLASTFERRLKHRQVNVENISQLNSPSEVENDFRDFLDGERMEAWDIIENSLFSTHTIENDVKIRYLACIIFVAAYEQMEEAREAAKDFFNNISRHLIDEAPRKSQELCIKRKESGCSAHFPVKFNISVEHQEVEDNKDVLDDLMLSLKQSAHSCDLKCFEEDVRQMVLKRWEKCLKEETEMALVPPFPDKPEDLLSELGDYIKTSIRLSWKMVTQAPPLGLEYRKLKFSPKYHTSTRLQNNSEGTGQGQYKKVVYLWPGLLENEQRVIFRGEVLCI